MNQVPPPEVCPSKPYVAYTITRTAIITNRPRSIDTNQNNSNSVPMIEAKEEVYYPVAYCNGHFGYIQQGYLHIIIHLTTILILFIIVMYGFGYGNKNVIYDGICIFLFTVVITVYKFVKNHVNFVYFLYILLTFLSLSYATLPTLSISEEDVIYALIILITIIFIVTITLIIMGENIYKSILIAEVFVVSGISFVILAQSRELLAAACIILLGLLYGLYAIINTFLIKKFDIIPEKTCVAVVMELYLVIVWGLIIVLLFVLKIVLEIVAGFCKCLGKCMKECCNEKKYAIMEIEKK